MEKNKYRIRSAGLFYRVDIELEESYGFFFRKVRKVWTPLDIMGRPIFWYHMPADFESKKEARAFIKRIEEKDEII